MGTYHENIRIGEKPHQGFILRATIHTDCADSHIWEWATNNKIYTFTATAEGIDYITHPNGYVQEVDHRYGHTSIVTSLLEAMSEMEAENG